jgi:uncharacterized protein YhfF
VLSGEKTATSSLLLEHQGGEELPKVGSRSVVVDSADRPVCVIEVTEVRILRVDTIDEQFARDEGEGFETVADWRAAHEAFWRSAEMEKERGDGVEIDDDTMIVAERFHLVERLP